MNILEEKRFGIDFKVNCILMEWSEKEAYIPSNIVQKNINDLCSIQLFENMKDVNMYIKDKELTSSPLLYHLNDEVTDLATNKKAVVATFVNVHNNPFYIVVPIDNLNEEDFETAFINTLANANQILVVMNKSDGETSEKKKELVVIAS